MSAMAKIAFVYLTNNPNKSINNLLRLKQQLSENGDVDLYICGYGKNASKTMFEGIPFYTFDESQALSLGFTGKHRFDKDGQLTFIPGNSDYNYLLFYHKHSNYEHYYCCEDDVVYSGDMSELITELQVFDDAILCTHITRYVDSWTYANLFTPGNLLAPPPAYLAFLPFARISNQGFKAMFDAFSQGVGGHSEMTLPYAIQAAGLSMRDIGGEGEFVSPELKNKYYVGRKTQSTQVGTFICNPASFAAGKRENCLYHPVKPAREVLFTRWRRLKSIASYYTSKLQRQN
jgi:hypothetical protein